jgi:hypothetical protein
LCKSSIDKHLQLQEELLDTYSCLRGCGRDGCCGGFYSCTGLIHVRPMLCRQKFVDTYSCFRFRDLVRRSGITALGYISIVLGACGIVHTGSAVIVSVAVDVIVAVEVSVVVQV